MDAYAWTQTTDHTGVRGDTPDKPLVPSRPSAAWPECDAHGARGSCKCSHARAQRVYGSAGLLSHSALEQSPMPQSQPRPREHGSNRADRTRPAAPSLKSCGGAWGDTWAVNEDGLRKTYAQRGTVGRGEARA